MGWGRTHTNAKPRASQALLQIAIVLASHHGQERSGEGIKLSARHRSAVERYLSFRQTI